MCFETLAATLDDDDNLSELTITTSCCKPSTNLTLVVVLALLRFMDIELLQGILKLTSFFPQYFTSARFDGAIAVEDLMGASIQLSSSLSDRKRLPTDWNAVAWDHNTITKNC